MFQIKGIRIETNGNNEWVAIGECFGVQNVVVKRDFDVFEVIAWAVEQ